MSTFGERLRELRKSKNMTIQGMADFLGVSRRLITFYETNEREPNYEALKKLSELFDCTTDYLLGLSDDTSEAERLKRYIEINSPDDEILSKMSFTLDGIQLTEEESRSFLEFIRDQIKKRKQKSE